MKKLITIIIITLALTTSVIAKEAKHERLECFEMDNQEICLTHDEMLQIIIEFAEILKNNK